MKFHDWDQIATEAVATIVEVYYRQMGQESFLKSIFRACHGALLLLCAPFPLRQINIEENSDISLENLGRFQKKFKKLEGKKYSKVKCNILEIDLDL